VNTQRVLFDGWALSRAPGSPAALHLAAALATLADDIAPILALPEEAPGPDWLPEGVESYNRHTANSGWSQLDWEQRILKQAAREVDADALFLSTARAPVASRFPHLASPSGWALREFRQPGAQAHSGEATRRLRDALGRGGLSASHGVLWPQDLPQPHHFPNLASAPPLAHPLFQPFPPPPDHQRWTGFELPETYILYHGPLDRTSIEILFEAWSWAAGPVGRYYPLLLYGGRQSKMLSIEAMIREAGLMESVMLLPAADSDPACSDPAQIAALYQGCRALFQPGPVSPWGDPLTHALACGKPVVAAANTWSEQRIGPAGYLAPALDARQLGAALITVCVEDEVADGLQRAAVERSRRWAAHTYRQVILSLFNRLSA
jgi:glycosyltransferase involved in cell wall biosynthesis